MIFIVLQCKRCFLQILDRGMIFKSKVYWMKWFSSSCSSKGVSFKFQIDAWYSNPKSTESNGFYRLTVQNAVKIHICNTEWNDFHRLTVQKGFYFKFQIDAWYSNPKSTESNDFHRLTVQKAFLSNFR